MRRYFLVGTVLVAAAATSAPVMAQNDDRHQTSDTIVIRDDHEPGRMMRIMMNRRARLGIKVNLQARQTDSLGAYVDAVTPGSPASKAGIRSGDIITKLNGKSVLTEQPDDGPSGQSLSGLRLIELAARLGPNDTVSVEFLRGKDRKSVSVVTEDEPDMLMERGPGTRSFQFRVPGPGDHMTLPPGGFARQFDLPAPGGDFFAGGPLADLELAPLNADLGQYFGTNEGVLVISAPKDTKLGLKGGDVVLAVDGRKPTGPFHLMRILHSYDRGETFKLDVLRNRKRETISAQLSRS